jgi:PAS domain S-box-containing protein
MAAICDMIFCSSYNVQRKEYPMSNMRVGSAPVHHYVFAIVAVLLAWFLRVALNPVLGAGVPFILFFPTVVLVAWFGGFGPGIVSTVLGAIISWYFLIPTRSVIVPEASAPAQLIVFLLASTLISVLAESLHRQTRKAEAGEAREREQRQRFHVTLSSIGDAVIATDDDGRVTFMNSIAESLTGWTYSECSGRPLKDVFNIVNEETRTPLENPALRALQRGEVVGLANHTVLIARDGSEHPIDNSAAPIITEDAGLTGAVLVFRDITRRRAAERQIRESRERLRTTLSSIGDAVLATDSEGRVTYVNPVAEKLLGYSFAEASGRNLPEVFNIVNEFTRQTTENPVDLVLRTGKIVGLANHTLLIRPDGSELPIDDCAAPIQDDSGHMIGVVLVFRDITDRRRAQKDQALLAAIVESSEDSIISIDLQGRIMTWNAGAERLFGYQAEEIIGRPIFVLIPRDHANEEATILEHVGRGEKVQGYETVRLRNDGRPVDISLSISPVRDNSGAIIGVAKIARDISDRKRMEQDLLEADKQKDNFLALLAHELRNPLGPIRNAVKILELQRRDDKDLLSYCALIDTEVGRITRLLDDLLDISRITKGKMAFQKEPLDLREVVNSAVQTSRLLIDEKGHKIVVCLPPTPVTVYGDSMRLAQVFSNLLNNAAKFSESGGEISVTVNLHDDQAIVRVKDTGIGISPDLLPKVFDIFVQGGVVTERRYEGLGLGLTLARDIVEFHGGTIEARSEGEDQGSEFIVCLPLSDVPSSEEASSATVKRLASGERSQGRVVVVEDNKNQALTLQRLLTQMGYEVHIAHDGSSAMKLLTNFVPDFAFIDIGLPRMNGYDLARWLRQKPEFRNTILIAQTGWGRNEDRAQSRSAGFDHHLIKPLDYQRLREILAQASMHEGEG